MARKKDPVNPRDFKGQNDDYVLQIVMEDMQRAMNYQKSFFDNFRRMYEVYNCYKDPKNQRPHGANLYIPYVYSIVETTIPKLLGSIFDSKPFISYKPVGADDTEASDKMTNLVAYQMKQKMKAATRFYEIFKTNVIMGTAISKQTWEYRTKKTLRRDATIEEIELDDGTMQEVETLGVVEVERVIYDAPVIQNIPLESFFFDPAYTEIYTSPFVCHEYWKEKHELVKGEEAGIYKNTKKITGGERQDGALAERLSTTAENEGNMRDGVRIWEYYTDDYKVLIANKNTVIQVIENPFFHKTKPFTKWCMIPMPNEFYGKSPVESLMDLQDELNTLRNQRIDNITFALNRMWQVRRSANIDTTQLVSRPNGFIEVDEIDSDIKELKMDDVTSSAYNDEEIIKTDMDVTSGVHSYDRGQQAERRDTATVASILTSASSERFKMQLMMMEEDPMADVGRQLAELNKQFLEDDTWIRITKEDGTVVSEPISFADIDADYDIMAVGTAIEASVNQEIRQTQLIQLLNVSADMPEINRVELMKEIFKEFEFKDIEKLVQAPPPPQMPEETPETMGQGGEVPGLYPQIGGVGGMGSFLQQPQV